MIPLTTLGAKAAIGPAIQFVLRYWWVGAIAGLLALTGFRTWQRDQARLQLAQEQTARANETIQRQRVADEYKAGLAALKREHEINQQEKDDAFNKDKAALVAAADARVAAARSLRDKLTASTARRSEADPTDPVACQRDADRLEHLGGLAGEGVAVVAEARSLLDQRDLEVKRLLDQIKIDRAACSPTS